MVIKCELSFKAYNDIVTMSMVTARTVGIGTYLVRLGQRVVQVEKCCLRKHISELLLSKTRLLSVAGGELLHHPNRGGGRGQQVSHHHSQTRNLMSVCYRLPVIFLKDVSSKDFERLLWYMYKGEVGSRITKNTHSLKGA